MSGRAAASATILAGTLLLVLYGAHVHRFLGYVNDDAYITFRYSANLATGAEPYFNLGEHVEGYTNLSLMLAMAAVHAVAGADAVPPAAKGLGAAAAATLLFSPRSSRDVSCSAISLTTASFYPIPSTPKRAVSGEPAPGSTCVRERSDRFSGWVVRRSPCSAGSLPGGPDGPRCRWRST